MLCFRQVLFISLPRIFPLLVAAHTQSCSPPRCQPAGSRCRLSPLPWSRFWSDCRGGARGCDSVPGWAACEARGSPPPPPACGLPSSRAPAGSTPCTEGCGAGIQVETATLASHLQEKETKHFCQNILEVAFPFNVSIVRQGCVSNTAVFYADLALQGNAEVHGKLGQMLKYYELQVPLILKPC